MSRDEVEANLLHLAHLGPFNLKDNLSYLGLGDPFNLKDKQVGLCSSEPHNEVVKLNVSISVPCPDEQRRTQLTSSSSYFLAALCPTSLCPPTTSRLIVVFCEFEGDGWVPMWVFFLKPIKVKLKVIKIRCFRINLEFSLLKLIEDFQSNCVDISIEG